MFSSAARCIGKVRAMFDDHGRPVKQARAFDAGRSAGFAGRAGSGRPLPGDRRSQGAPHRGIPAGQAARSHAGAQRRRAHHAWISCTSSSKPARSRNCRIVIKADVQGSVEVLSEMLPKLSTDQVKLKIIQRQRRRRHGKRRSAGFGFGRDHFRVQRAAGPQGGRSGAARKRRDSPALHHLRSFRRNQDGHGRVCSSRSTRKRIWAAPKCATRSASRASGTIAGCYVLDGVLKRDAEVRVLRDGAVIYTSKLQLAEALQGRCQRSAHRL